MNLGPEQTSSGGGDAKSLDAFVREMDGRLAGCADPLEHLRTVLEHDDLDLYAQPIATLEGGGGHAMAEVLVRLRHEESSLVPPGEFLPLFEHHGMIAELDRWVLRNALQHLSRGSSVSRLALNVAGRSARTPEFRIAVAEELLEAGMLGSSLIFEIDETTLLLGGEALSGFVSAVKKLGCGITIDGFGRRAVSFAPLKGGWVDFVKVEGAIVRKLLHSEIAEIRLSAMVHVGRVMGFRVIAEMVEDAELLIKLLSLGVSFAQGYGVGKPKPIESFAAPG